MPVSTLEVEENRSLSPEDWINLSEEDFARRFVIEGMGLDEHDEVKIQEGLTAYFKLYSGPGKSTLRQLQAQRENTSKRTDRDIMLYCAIGD
jgi:hypothetical protein